MTARWLLIDTGKYSLGRAPLPDPPAFARQCKANPAKDIWNHAK